MSKVFIILLEPVKILDPFQLTENAILDIDAIWLYLLEKEGSRDERTDRN